MRYIPVLLEFDKQREEPVLDTVMALATLARFVVVDLIDLNMVRSELTAITVSVPTVPIRHHLPPRRGRCLWAAR